ncbi:MULTISPECIES: FtsX-like permease family protein [unclassified Azospirillum]|uniref:FtsX-like permease family protein n=1 Tax=unclassified Azospirillum TaxID=2630922 RepID=UPI000B6B1A0F|nr:MULTISPECIES: ABC transporter permease [unclassified Azospirillum]SNS16781.1 putative ABC transport system permease protein [Azospirillum sp. RU38E]SNS34070.1 putative ABC transport system permease protein [Azospirillum sp. RU37A]
MNMLTLSLAYLRQRALTSLLNLLLLALGVATISFLLMLDRRIEDRLARDVAGFDMVVGAKGSPLQLVMSALLHIDTPTGNVPLSALDTLRANRLVREVVPVALGDNYQGYRIVGTEPAYIDHYGGKLAQGQLFAQPMEAVLGATAAATAGLKIGDSFAGSHGLTAGGEVHSFAPYKVVGILAPTGSVLDRLVLTPVASVWAVHEHHHHHHHDGDDHDEDADGDHDHDHDHAMAGADHDEDHDHDHDAKEEAGHEPHREVTALLVRYATPLAAARLPREINTGTDMQAASPATEMLRLRSLLGIGVDTMKLFGGVLVLAAALGTFIALANSLQERRYDLAIMRTLGATRSRILGQILTEALLVGGAGALLGFGLAHLGMVLMGRFSAQARDLGLAVPSVGLVDLWPLALALGTALLAALLPAIRAYRGDVARMLAQR